MTNNLDLTPGAPGAPGAPGERQDVPLARPTIGDEELAALAAVLTSGQLSRGEELIRFEASMAALAGTAGAVGVNSGTMGLQIAMEALDIGPGDEVITVSYTFVGTVNAIVHAGGTAVLVDVDPHTLNMAPAALADAITPRTRAVLVVHLFGRPAPMDRIAAIASSRGVAVIEDACEAIGAEHGGRPVGGWGDVGVFGFYPNKPITTGEGGVIVSSDRRLLACCRRLRSQGIDLDTGEREARRAGHSARLSELHAAVGNVQLARLGSALADRAGVAAAYLQRLATERRIELPSPLPSSDRASWFTFPVRLRDADASERDRVVAALRRDGVGAGVYFEPVHRLPFHANRHRHGPLPTTEDVGRRSIGLPLFADMTTRQVDRVVTALGAALDGSPDGG